MAIGLFCNGYSIPLFVITYCPLKLLCEGKKSA